jgi:malic enzyme
MALGAADALARVARAGGLSEQRVLPHMSEIEAHVQVALATAAAATREGLARIAAPADLEATVRRRIDGARALSALLMREALPPPPRAVKHWFR